MLNSLFRSYILKINQTTIEEGHGHFMLSYLSNLSTFTHDAQDSWMQAQGWSQDHHKHWNDRGNNGLEFRCNRFRKNLKAGNEFSDEGCCLFGHLDHCLTTIEKSLPPETTIELTLRRAKSELFIHEPENDLSATQKLKVVIKEILCFMPVEHLSDDLAISLRSRWEKEPLTYHYRTLRFNSFAIPHQIQVTTNLLYPDSLHPIRLYAFIVEDKTLSGNFKTTPFEWRTNWIYKRPKPPPPGPPGYSDPVNSIKSEIDEIKSLLYALQRQSASTEEEPGSSEKNKGKGKNTRSKKSDAERRDSSWGEKLVQAFRTGANLEEERCSEASSASIVNIDEDTPLAEVRNILHNLETDDEFTVYLQSLKLEINGQDLDQIPAVLYESNALFDFVRFNLCNETFKTLFGNNIHYEKYMKGFYLAAWDLSTSQTAGISVNILPMILSGYILFNFFKEFVQFG